MGIGRREAIRRESMRGFSLTIGKLAPDVVCVGLSGELDLSRALLLEQELRALEATEPSGIVVDLTDLDFADSSGLARLVAAHRRAERGGWRLILIQGTGRIRRLLALSALNSTFHLVDAPEDALMAVAS
jgi:anti-sigma B factor antagonist